MSEDSDRDELKALKDGFETLARREPPRDVGIAFSPQACRRLGSLIAGAVADWRESKRRQD